MREETGSLSLAQPLFYHPFLLPASCSLSSPLSPQRVGPLAVGNQGPALQCEDHGQTGPSRLSLLLSDMLGS